MVRDDSAEDRKDELELLMVALLEACVFCDQVENRPRIARLLAEKRFIDAPAECIRAGFVGQLDAGADNARGVDGGSVFSRFQANDPTAARAQWITSQLYRFSRWSRRPAEIDRVFRRDLYLGARNLLKAHPPLTKAA